MDNNKAQPAQEPVEDVVEYFADGTKVVRIAPQRPWADLTPQDYAEIFRTARNVDHAARLATAKLKEKNT